MYHEISMPILLNWGEIFIILTFPDLDPFLHSARTANDLMFYRVSSLEYELNPDILNSCIMKVMFSANNLHCTRQNTSCISLRIATTHYLADFGICKWIFIYSKSSLSKEIAEIVCFDAPLEKGRLFLALIDDFRFHVSSLPLKDFAMLRSAVLRCAWLC